MMHYFLHCHVSEGAGLSLRKQGKNMHINAEIYNYAMHNYKLKA
ncbi:putative ORFan [Tupanvirus deep ocean]|uniref:ORFan n=2 Tax=Tupanvirus TaxID=2094720 RepID=A0AC62A6V3_9VIRU|nr:putative ORFan [Tupanvirus deep ocean]QKU33456.1 putative ORFan [Tupanvirus deep ocean]